LIDLGIPNGSVFDVCVHSSETGKFTAFCPLCRIQVFGEDDDEVAEDVAEHMGQRHPR
jgi:hypothetical protein